MPAADQLYTKRQRTLTMIPLIIGGFIALMNETLLNVAFPRLMVVLDVPTTTIQWLATAYMLVIGILVPVVAFFTEYFFHQETLYGGDGSFYHRNGALRP